MFLALSDDPKDRGTIVAQGGGKVRDQRSEHGSDCYYFFNPFDMWDSVVQALIPLATEGTDAGKIKASHALAKIAAVSNPEIAFPGERVRPFYTFPVM